MCVLQENRGSYVSVTSGAAAALFRGGGQALCLQMSSAGEAPHGRLVLSVRPRESLVPAAAVPSEPTLGGQEVWFLFSVG